MRAQKSLFSFLLLGTFATYALYLQQFTQSRANAPVILEKNLVVPRMPTQQMPMQAPMMRGLYRDGTYLGSNADAYYGNVQVKAVIQDGKITDVQFLDHPKDQSNSIVVNEYAMPRLKTEAIRAQRATVDVVSGATATSRAFVQSLTAALAQAKN